MGNKEYERIIEYLYEILHKLQNESDLLRNKDIAICLSNEKSKTNNAQYNFPSDTIIMGLNYLKKHAKNSEDAVAAIIAHELSHKIFRQKYSTTSGKEEEIFADNYGLILCNKAGYNTNISLWNDSLSADLNYDVHPQHKIRQLVMNRTSARLNNKAQINPFRENIPPKDTLQEYYLSLIEQRKRNKKSLPKITHLITDVEILNEGEDSEHNSMGYLLSIKHLNKEHKASIRRLDLRDCDCSSVIKLYEKVRKSPSLFNDELLLEKFRDGLIQHKLFMDDYSVSSDALAQLDTFFVNKIEKESSIEKKLDMEKRFMHVNHRCSQEHDRKKIYTFFANTLKELYGTDNGSNDYIQNIEKQLSELSGKIHNADVIPLAQILKSTLNISSDHFYVLQNFVKCNSFEVQQIRTETMITECLLNSEQAFKTVNYLIRDDVPPFQFRGGYDKSLSKIQYSYIDSEMLKDIHTDLANISPDKRADIFILLMENIPAENAFEKLSLFVNKKDKNSLTFQPIVEAYLNTYPQEQQNAVVATLVSLKEIDKDFGYEECFKTILKNSGINGHRIYDKLYQTEASDTIYSIHRNYEPLYSNGEIVYSNLSKLEKILSQMPDQKSQEIGKLIKQATFLKLKKKESCRV